MAHIEPEMKPDEITGNLDKNEEHQLAVDKSEVVDINRDKELQRLEENLNLYFSLWAAAKKEYGQYFRDAKPDCTGGPTILNVDGDEEQQLTRDISVAVDSTIDKEIQKADENPNSLESAAANREYDKLYEDAFAKLNITGNLNEDEEQRLRKGKSVVVDITCDEEIQRADEIRILKEKLKSVDLWAAANSEYSQVTGSGFMDELLEAFSAAYPQSDPDIELCSWNQFFLLEANNICKAAYEEVLLKARVAGMVGSLEELKEIIPSSSSGVMRVECSIETAIFPVQPNDLASMMMDVDTWAISLPELIYQASDNDLTAVFKQLTGSDGNGNGNIAAVKMVTAEVRLPTHLVGSRKFCFFRFQRMIAKDTWAIFDISQDCFPNRQDDFISKRMCLRRPSGVIIRAHENYSEVIWIENVEVNELPLENNIYSALLNSNIAFSAKHWVSTFSHRMHRNKNSEIWVKDDMKVKEKVMVYLRDLCDRMKKIFSQCVHEYPDKESFTILSDDGIRILKDATGNYIGVASFRIKSKPITVLDYVSKKDINLEWSTSTMPYQEVIKQTTEEPYNRITLYREDSALVPQKIYKSILQEVSRDHFCSYVISAPLTEIDVDNLLWGQCVYTPMHPTGFAIMPDGFGGLYSDASLVTFVVHRQLDGGEGHCALDTMIDLVTTTIGDIEKVMGC